MAIAISKNRINIRLTDERWQHITTGHPEIAAYYYELLETIEEPDIIYEGNNNANIAIKKFKERNDKFVVVIYKEEKRDGFIITAYFSNRQQEFKTKKILWKQHS